MEWYVLNHDFNADKIELFNIFRSSHFVDGVERALKEYTTFEKFKEDIANELQYSFWSKAEYEILVSGLHSKNDRTEKIDIYDQVLPNVDILARYIVESYNKRKRKKLVI